MVDFVCVYVWFAILLLRVLFVGCIVVWFDLARFAGCVDVFVWFVYLCFAFDLRRVGV